MKTKIFFSALLLMAATFANQALAQVELGVRHGVAASTFSAKGNLADNDKVTFSYTSGMFLTLPVSNSFALQPELNYLKKGRSNETTALGTTTQTDFRVNYLQIPLQLQYRNNQISKSGNTAFYFQTGPYAAFALENERRVKSGRTSEIVVSEDDTKTDWGIAFGLGVQFPVVERNVRFDLKYDLGLSEIGGQPDDFRTKCLSLTVGVVL